MKILTTALVAVMLAIFGVSAQAMAIFSTGDSILGGQRIAANFVTGTTGFTGGANNWPGAEGPEHLIDGVGQKYLNFGEFSTGAIITPNFGASVATSLQLWTANDAIERDPASYELWGTNSLIDASLNAMASFNLIASGALSLPDTRNGGGGTALDAANSGTIGFANGAGYTSYLLLFPSVKDAASANSMQIAEAQLFGTALPEPGTLALLAIGFAGIGLTRRRKLG